MGVRLNGSTSGYVELNAPAVAGTTTLELPTDSIKPGLVLVAAQSFTAASTVSVDNCFTSIYTNYRIVANITGSSSEEYLHLRLRASAADNSASTYSCGNAYLAYAAGTSNFAADTGSVNDTKFYVGYTHSTIGQLSNHAFEVFSPQLATRTFYECKVVGQFLFQGGGSFTGTNQFDGFTIYPASGTITGSLQVYGYRKA